MADYRQYRRYYGQWQRLYQKQEVKDLTFIVLSLFTIAFFGLFAIKPSLKTISGLIKEIEDKKQVSEQLEKKINSLSVAQKEYLRVQPDLPFIYAALPQKSEFSKLIKQLEYLASKNGVQLSSFEVKKVSLTNDLTKNTADFKPAPLELSFGAKGDYPNLRGFLIDLENLERLIILKSFSFDQKKIKVEAQRELSLLITAHAYSLP